MMVFFSSIYIPAIASSFDRIDGFIFNENSSFIYHFSIVYLNKYSKVVILVDAAKFPLSAPSIPVSADLSGQQLSTSPSTLFSSAIYSLSTDLFASSATQ